ncbi:hypothetical protein [Streptomyces sp. NPDC021212]|uniref:hypothetical protein n=1 Tax=Streptomyces sp. NPDC021212 TaxID=3365118 RepID=UPI00379ECF6F
MLPTEPPLSLHRLIAPVPPARTPETATATRQVPAPAPVPEVPAKPLPPFEGFLVMEQNQVGNAAVAGVASRTSPAAPVPMVVPPITIRGVQAP